MEMEATIKKQILEIQHKFNMQLEQAKMQKDRQREELIEDRKDKRTRISGTQQSQMIDQRKNNLLPKDFETTNPNNTGDMGVEPLMP